MPVQICTKCMTKVKGFIVTAVHRNKCLQNSQPSVALTDKEFKYVRERIQTKLDEEDDNAQ